MNCLEFRRRVLAEPHSSDDARERHASECAQCQRFAEETLAIESELERVVKVTPDSGLADRILFNRKRNMAQTYRYWSTAATLVLSITIAWFWQSSPRVVVQDAIAHVRDEPETLRAAERHEARELPRMFAHIGAALEKPVGELNYRARCPFPGGYVEHLVLATAHGNVTVLLLPKHDAREVQRSESDDGFVAVVKPAFRGSYAIVAKSQEQLAATETALSQAIRWQIDVARLAQRY